MGFSYSKWIILGCEMGVPPFEERHIMIHLLRVLLGFVQRGGKQTRVSFLLGGGVLRGRLKVHEYI